MAYSSRSLPSRFPVGTKYVVEGRGGVEGQFQVYSRYLEFPDGTLLELPATPVPRSTLAATARRNRRRPRTRRH